MEIEYNGVRLEMGEIQAIRREVVWDETHTHLLYIKWVIGVIAHYAPNGYPVGVSVTGVRDDAALKGDNGGAELSNAPVATGFYQKFVAKIRKLLRGKDAKDKPVQQRKNLRSAYAPRAGTSPEGGADGASGYGPILTDVTLRNKLLVPRKTLKVTGWDSRTGKQVTLVQAPTDGYVCDVANGPHPIACDILSGNDNAFAVFFQIECATLPCEDDSDRLILSHTWEMTHSHDEDQYLTQIVEGELTLNGAMVHSLDLYADQFRAQFFHPIPLGCYRTIPFVTPSADGLSYRYRIEDHDQRVIFDAGDSGATHMEIVEKVGYSQPWTALGTVNRVI